MVDLVLAIGIMVGLGYLGFVANEYLNERAADDMDKNQIDEFCDIEVDHMLMYSDRDQAKDLNELKRKLQDFKNRNKFYKM